MRRTQRCCRDRGRKKEIISVLGVRPARRDRPAHRGGKYSGVNFSGFLAWWLWRTIYLLKLPRFEKKMRVALDWTLDLCFAKDFACVTARHPLTMTASKDSNEKEATRAA